MKLGLLGAPLGGKSVADLSAVKTGKKRYTARVGLKLGLKWEIYPILLIAAALRFYMINKTEFDADQATIFSMAHDAVSHGQLVATSNVASIGIVNPPAIVYFLMLPAVLSSNPVWGAVLTAFFATLAVLLTYIFVHCYYGRLAATIAAFLYATAALPVFYSRFMWQQNLLLFFAPLYILLLFHGAVARRQGWLGPALFLLGLLLQLHGSAFLLVVPLLIAVAVAPYTVRWRDVSLGLLLLLVSYAPYILWETSVHFHDISVLFNTTRRPSSIDLQALTLYQFLLSPYNVLSMSPRSLLAPFVSLFNGIWWVMTALVVGSAVLALGLVLGLRPTTDQVSVSGNVAFEQLKLWWRALCASPYCCGLSVLLSWQIVPLLSLLHHSIILHPHYFIMFMPGPFILVGIFVTEAIVWLRERGRWGILGYRTLLGIMAVIVIAQTIGAAVSVVDLTEGNFIDSTHTLSSGYYNDLDSLQHTLSEADRIAKIRHLKHIYIGADTATIDAFRYLSTQMHTPTTVFSDSCTLLPNLVDGPVVLLVGARSSFIETLLSRFVTVSLIAAPARLGGPPFRIYILSSVKQPVTVEDTFAPDLQLVGAQSFAFQDRPFLLTRWRFLLSQPSADGTLYSYNMVPAPDAATVMSLNQNRGGHTRYRAARKLATVKCALTSVQAGDQLFVSFQLPSEQQASLNLRVQASTIKDDDITVGFPSFRLAFETFLPVRSSQRILLSSQEPHG